MLLVEGSVTCGKNGLTFALFKDVFSVLRLVISIIRSFGDEIDNL